MLYDRILLTTAIVGVTGGVIVRKLANMWTLPYTILHGSSGSEIPKVVLETVGNNVEIKNAEEICRKEEFTRTFNDLYLVYEVDAFGPNIFSVPENFKERYTAQRWMFLHELHSLTVKGMAVKLFLANLDKFGDKLKCR